MNNKSFIRIGDLVLPRESIASFDLDHIEQEYGVWPDGDGTVTEYRPVHYVTLTTHERTPEAVGTDGWVTGNREYRYKHGTAEVDAIIAWLEPQTEVII